MWNWVPILNSSFVKQKASDLQCCREIQAWQRFFYKNNEKKQDKRFFPTSKSRFSNNKWIAILPFRYFSVRITALAVSSILQQKAL
jgi:hypothetical protein